MKFRTRGGTVRSSSRVWGVLIVCAVLGFAFGGCGTLSSSVASESSMLASRVPVAAPAEPALPEPPAMPNPVAPANTAHPATAPVVVTYEPVTSENAPAWVVALSGPVDPSLRGTPDTVPPDPDVEEDDPWEEFNAKMFNFNYNLDKYVLKPGAKGYNYDVPDMFQTMIDNAFTN